MNPNHFGPVFLDLTIALSVYVLGLAASRGVCAMLSYPEAL